MTQGPLSRSVLEQMQPSLEQFPRRPLHLQHATASASGGRQSAEFPGPQFPLIPRASPGGIHLHRPDAYRVRLTCAMCVSKAARPLLSVSRFYVGLEQ